MTKIQLHLLGFISILILWTSCASVTGFQDGRTLGKEKIELSSSLNFSRSPKLANTDDGDWDDLENIFWPNVEVGGRYGVLEDLDINFRFNTSANISAGVKYQLYGGKDSPIAFSLGGEVGSIGFLALWNPQLPAYFSYHPSEKIALYLSPRYIYQFSSYVGSGYGINYLGFNTGFLVGKRNKFGLDIGYYSLGNRSASTWIDLLQIGFGGRFMLFDKKN